MSKNKYNRTDELNNLEGIVFVGYEDGLAVFRSVHHAGGSQRIPFTRSALEHRLLNLKRTGYAYALTEDVLLRWPI
jgi:hypothetical protein